MRLAQAAWGRGNDLASVAGPGPAFSPPVLKASYLEIGCEAGHNLSAECVLADGGRQDLAQAR